MGGPGCGSLAWLWVPRGAAGEELGAELPWEQGAVLHCHPKPRPSESVFLLFQLKRKQERLPPPLPSARRCLALCLLSWAAALKPLVVSSRQVAPGKDGREGSRGSRLRSASRGRGPARANDRSSVKAPRGPKAPRLPFPSGPAQPTPCAGVSWSWQLAPAGTPSPQSIPCRQPAQHPARARDGAASSAHQQAVLLGQAGAAVPQVLQRTQELRVLAHEEAVVSPALQNSAGEARQGFACPGRGGEGPQLHALPGPTVSPAWLRGEAGRVGVQAAKGQGGMQRLISGGGEGLHVLWGMSGLRGRATSHVGDSYHLHSFKDAFNLYLGKKPRPSRHPQPLAFCHGTI